MAKRTVKGVLSFVRVAAGKFAGGIVLTDKELDLLIDHHRRIIDDLGALSPDYNLARMKLRLDLSTLECFASARATHP